ncbi:MAG: cysteine--tRNA ligase [Candidatus Omnitrophica bacterium]|nr:cysteine--tRNA ligase [Candidatus Omnitrophota bacterium]MDD5592998.1 cysteine--tRNA ligase [Candidatus Omnitrophota bacterium]
MKIYNSLSREKEVFEPINPPQVKMYVCGPTVYDEPHIGHARSAYIFDVIRRYLIYKKYKVTFVRNVTDVDDKIIDKARNEFKGEDLNSACKKVADKYLAMYHEALDSLGITASGPDIIEPKASEYIGKMIEFIENLIDRGVAYPSGGDVYFDIKKAKEYGKLSNQSIDKMEVGARVTPGENKNDPLDFALWKAAKEGEPSWDSPWGKGRPGWHIECSVMSSDILGDKFDIHGGGIDLIFPHHENEIAQSEGAGKEFAKYWIHHGLLTINSQKMAKSLGNFVTVKDLLAKYNSDVLKLFFLQTHYSQPIDFTWDRMEEKKSALETLRDFSRRVKEAEERKDYTDKAVVNPEELCKEIGWYRNRFEPSMDDDFNTPNVVAVLFEIVRFCNKKINYTQEYLQPLRYASQTIKELGSILGLSLDEDTFSITEEIGTKINRRTELKKQKKFKEADQIRQDLEKEGIILEDTKDGKTIWRRKL